MTKKILSGAFSLLLVMVFMPGAVVGEQVEGPDAVTEETPAKVEISSEQNSDIPTRSDAVVSSEIAPSEHLVFLSEPSFLVDGDNQAMPTSGIYIGYCSLTCSPCISNASCPVIFGRPQKCLAQCP